MAVSGAYLAKIKRAVRLTSTAEAITYELIDTIEEGRADLTRLGIPSAVAASETDYHVLDAIKRYARWRFAMEPGEAQRCQDEYREKADELRRMRDYAYLTVTFTVKTAGAVAIHDALVTFNGESIYTTTAGVAAFYYVSVGQNQTYTVTADGYVSQEADLDVTASASVAVTMVAA